MRFISNVIRLGNRTQCAPSLRFRTQTVPSFRFVQCTTSITLPKTHRTSTLRYRSFPLQRARDRPQSDWKEGTMTTREGKFKIRKELDVGDRKQVSPACPKSTQCVAKGCAKRTSGRHFVITASSDALKRQVDGGPSLGKRPCTECDGLQYRYF